jgi:voltage-gated potassium channel
MEGRLSGAQGVAGQHGKLATYGLLALDLVALGWVILESFLPESNFVFAVDITLGCAGDGLAAAAQLPRRRKLMHPAGSPTCWPSSLLLAPFYRGGVPAQPADVRLLRSARSSAHCARDLPVSAQPKPEAAADRGVHHGDDGIGHARSSETTEHRNWADALYFTVTALTTTGFGDITLPGTSGRLISVIIMLPASRCSCGWRRHCSSRTRCASAAMPAGSAGTIRMRCTARPAAGC